MYKGSPEACSVLEVIIPIEREPFYRDIFFILPCKQLVQAFYKVGGVFECTAFQQQRLI